VFQREHIRPQTIIERQVQPKRVIADIGGGTGPYSFWLHDRGHTVHLLDATAAHIETAHTIAREHGRTLGSITVGDGRNLPYEDNTFDIVLLFGPLYHL